MADMQKLAGIVVLIMLAAAVAAQESGPLPASPLLAPDPPVSRLVDAAGDGTQVFPDMTPSTPGKQVSLTKAMILSLVLPGAGQYYADARFRGELFMGVEAAIWAGFLAYRVYGGWKKDDYQSYAAAYAGVDNAGKDELFYDMLGFYTSREDYNQFSRLYYPERAYYPDNRAYHWQWDSEAHRLQYKEFKDASKTAFRNSTFMIGLAVINRVIAGIDTYRTVKAAERKVASMTQFGDYRLSLAPNVLGKNPRISVTLSRRF
jgi:hypothetical protein